MSMALFAEIKQLKAQVESLRLSLRMLLERIEVLEAAPETVNVPPVEKRRGRPPKVAQ